MDKSHLTAISRKTLPLPTRWLLKQGVIQGRVLDFGCGKCHAINPKKWDNYDPHFYPKYFTISDEWDTIICNYVLCVLPHSERPFILKQIQSLLTLDGMALISVRNDKPKQGWGMSKRGTYQGRVSKLPLRQIYKCPQFRTYILTKTTVLI